MHTAWYGPLAALYTELFSTRSRYTGASLGYQIAGLGAGIAPLVFASVLAAGGGTLTISIIIAASASIGCILVIRETATTDLTVDPEAATVPAGTADRARSLVRPAAGCELPSHLEQQDRLHPDGCGMELRWMTAFVSVAEELSYRRAAQRLLVAQPAISQQIMNLEKELGVKLFDRNNRSVRLTDAGSAFLPPCRTALDAVDKAGLQACNAGTGEHGKIRIARQGGRDTARGEHGGRPHVDAGIRRSRNRRRLLRVPETTMSTQRLTQLPLADVPDIPTSLVWKAGTETPALHTVIRAAERHLLTQQTFRM